MLHHILKARAKRFIKNSLLFAQPKIKVKINQGIVKGVRESLPNGSYFYRFSGIPYAEKPFGNLRFKDPVKLMKFDHEIHDCTQEGDPCFHRALVPREYIGTENCLHLNVYTPADAEYKKLPVMVFIHGGGFTLDSNSVDFYSPEYLLMEDVIIVAINYRLHTLGFLSLPSMGISGNAGLKDQQMALEWVYENISYFNGDPDNICLFGESAGAASVFLHALNPKSRKFIKSGICQSGCAFNSWLYQKHGEEKTVSLAKIVGAKGNSDKDLYDALMAAPIKNLYDSSFKCRTSDEFRRSTPFTFKPTIERESENAFMSKSPLELIKSQAGQINFPMIIGSNTADGIITTNYLKNKVHLHNEDTVRSIPFLVNIDPLSKEAKTLGERIVQFYFGDKGACEETLQNFTNLYTDTFFFIPQTINVELNQKYFPNMIQYLFEFDFDGELNFMKKALKMEKIKGACHFDDISYLFRHQIIDVPVRKDSREYRMRDRMCKIWTNFAKYKNPTPHNNNPLPVSWDPVKSIDKNLKYMILDDNPRIDRNINSQRIYFWKEVLEECNGSFLNPNCP